MPEVLSPIKAREEVLTSELDPQPHGLFKFRGITVEAEKIDDTHSRITAVLSLPGLGAKPKHATPTPTSPTLYSDYLPNC